MSTTYRVTRALTVTASSVVEVSYASGELSLFGARPWEERSAIDAGRVADPLDGLMSPLADPPAG